MVFEHVYSIINTERRSDLFTPVTLRYYHIRSSVKFSPYPHSLSLFEFSGLDVQDLALLLYLLSKQTEMEGVWIELKNQDSHPYSSSTINIQHFKILFAQKK